ncbi:RsmB/NOP family class I SAM-dependent RNA methyltransferase [Sulfurisphaera tokodaii]|nr:RsmB/NOP family class I SAM-dependent RNA methyltransferase [Sulfurisphaera tokodaii]HII75030.1 RsmB/NOP family class I SAM-dependent RNA methyltransferase [Sulfurisphaera tokodaii]
MVMTIENYVKKYNNLFTISPSLKAISLASKYKFLSYMVERYIKIMGEEETEDFLYSCSFPLKKSVRCNDLLIECNKLEKIMENKGFKLEKVSWLKHGYIVKQYPSKPSLGATIEYLSGYYYIQGLASMVPPYVLDPNENDLVLDMAAAPGSKTTQLAQLMKNKGLIVAVEKSRERIKSLYSNVNRMKIKNVVLLRADARILRKLNIPFNKILLDVPCSGEGLIPEDPSRKTKTTIEDLKIFFQNQLELIDIAYNILEPGGILVYSSCSIAPEENEAVVNYIIENYGAKTDKIYGYPATSGITEFNGIKFDESLRNCIRFYPHKSGTEGFFVCKIIKE